MDQYCTEHNKPFAVACLQQGCEKKLLCLFCYRDHNQDHFSELLTFLEKDKAWIECHKINKQELENNHLFVSSPSQNDIIAYNKQLIQKMIDILVMRVQEKGKMLIEEMLQRFQEQNPIEKLSYALKKHEESLRKITFATDNTCELVRETKVFQEEISPKIKKSLVLIEEEIRMWTINPIKAFQTEVMIANSIIKMDLDDLFTYDNRENNENNNNFFQFNEFFSSQTVENDGLNLKKLYKEKLEKLYQEIRILKKTLKEKENYIEKLEIIKASSQVMIHSLDSINSIKLTMIGDLLSILDLKSCAKSRHPSGKYIYYCQGANSNFIRCSSSCKINASCPTIKLL